MFSINCFTKNQAGKIVIGGVLALLFVAVSKLFQVSLLLAIH